MLEWVDLKLYSTLDIDREPRPDTPDPALIYISGYEAAALWSPAFERATATVVGAVICQPGGEEEEEEEKESNEQSQREEPGQHAKQKTWHILKSSSCIHYYLDGSGSSHAMSHPRGLLRGLYRGSLLQTAQELFWGLYLPVHEQVQKHVTANIKWNIIRAQLGRVTVRPDKQHPEECYFFTYQAERDRIGDPEQNTQGMAAPVDIGERGLGTTRSQGMSQVLLSSPPLSTPVPGHHGISIFGDVHEASSLPTLVNTSSTQLGSSPASQRQPFIVSSKTSISPVGTGTGTGTCISPDIGFVLIACEHSLSCSTRITSSLKGD
ncbi:hypothetical protein VSDG_09515 [Cytospora chrysosperma]|uniref:Uncharacterized protein n=1 Tax=Cytospora chrysosperma TaxID=252740 RepID=A0A423VCW6_CYTCH|nr:hypothetical protein VSDG_09515 [Valsa sordida]